MQPLIWDRRPDGLRAPAMVCSFQGWNDAGDAASTATDFLAQALGARRFARIDSEEFYDFQANRPHVKIDETQARVISWPSVEIFEARAPRAHRDLVIVQGTEPSMRWRSFSSLVVDLAEALDVQLVVTLGGLLADVPHSQPVTMTGFASDPALMARLALNASSYEGPTGIVGVLHAGFGQAGLPSASIWASVPHYVAAAASPKAALALLRKLELMVGVSVDVTELEEAAAEYERQVGLAVRSDPDIQAFVDRLEQRAVEDGQAEISPQDLPSGDLLAREFQRFLRQRGIES
jgi:proteasome assembly chaperone (PAC2) family protein